jgi:hypothetical protein
MNGTDLNAIAVQSRATPLRGAEHLVLPRIEDRADSGIVINQ